MTSNPHRARFKPQEIVEPAQLHRGLFLSSGIIATATTRWSAWSRSRVAARRLL